MSPPTETRTVQVAVGIITRGEKILVTKRLPGSHLEGTWEFPGGKVEATESPQAALRREIEEELGLTFAKAVLFERRQYRYPERTVELSVYLCLDVEGTPRAVEGQDMRWLSGKELQEVETPAANREVIELLAAYCDESN